MDESDRPYFDALAAQLVGAVSAAEQISQFTSNKTVVGAFAESLVYQFVNRIVHPLRLSSGTVISPDAYRNKKGTPQFDLIIWDPDAKITKMKDGRTHLAHKAEHAVDLHSGALVAVTLHGADVGDTTTLVETAIAAAEQVETVHAASATPVELTELVADKGYHSNQTMIDLAAVAVLSYIAEPDRGRRHWTNMPAAQSAVYGNRRRVRGVRGKRLMRRRGEYVERSFAHVYDTGGLRRTHLRGHQNILKRLLVHAGAFNLGILMRKTFGRGTPRGLQGRRFDPCTLEIAFGLFFERVWTAITRFWGISRLTPNVLRASSTVALAW